MIRALLFGAAAFCLAVLAVPLFGLVALTALTVTAHPAAAATDVVIPYGDFVVSFVANYGGEVLLAVLLWLLRKLPRSLYETLQTFRVEQLLIHAVTFGLNSVSGAAAGRKLHVETGSEVISRAIAYAIENAPALVRWLGGPELLRDKIIARLEFDASVSKVDIETALSRAA